MATLLRSMCEHRHRHSELQGLRRCGFILTLIFLLRNAMEVTSDSKNAGTSAH